MRIGTRLAAAVRLALFAAGVVAQYHCASGDDAPGLLDYGFLAAVTRAQLGAHVDTLGLK